MFASMDRLLPVLVYIQAHLDEDLPLERLADAVQQSPFHFHRVFRSVTGETLKSYVERLRLERAAHQLMIQEARVVDLAFGLGYRSHETFSRAFRRRFGVSPRDYRRRRWAEFDDRSQQAAQGKRARLLNRDVQHYELSKVTVRRLDPLPVAFIRLYGPYVDVDVSAFDRLVDWARSHGFYPADALLIGVGHDNPAVTPPQKLRFDACLSVHKSFKPQGEVGFQVLPDGFYAMAEYVGPYGPTMERAYREMFDTMISMDRYTIIGLPVIEVYQTTRIKPDFALNYTTIYVPIEPKGV